MKLQLQHSNLCEYKSSIFSKTASQDAVFFCAWPRACASAFAAEL